MKNWIESNEASNKDIIIFSRVSIARNFKEILFTDKMKVEEARECVDKVYEVLSKKLPEEEFSVVKIWDSEYNYVKTFLERKLISESLLKRKDRSAFIINKSETLTIMINEEDNIRIECIVDGLNLEYAYKYIDSIDNIIEESMPYAFDENLGYLTATLSNVGTGLKASAMVHLPALSMSEEIPNILNGLNKVGMNIKGVYLENSKTLGNIYEVQNQITLGLKEEDIIKNLKGILDNIVGEEIRFREVLMEKYKDEVEDKIFRAYGILKNAKLLKQKEMLDLLSYLRLGVETDILDIDKSVLNKLLIYTRDSLLDDKIKRDNIEIKRDIYRSEIVKQFLN